VNLICPTGGTRPHQRLVETLAVDDVMIVIEGRLSVSTGGSTETAGPGEIIHMPKGEHVTIQSQSTRSRCCENSKGVCPSSKSDDDLSRPSRGNKGVASTKPPTPDRAWRLRSHVIHHAVDAFDLLMRGPRSKHTPKRLEARDHAAGH
jgi:hypothetical protein